MRLPVDKWVKKLLFHAYAPLGWARSPNHVSLDITRRCNLRCQMCFYYGGEGGNDLRLNELSGQEIISLVVNRLQGADYDLTGGEPLVRSDLVEILAAIRDRKAACFVTTNGTLMTPDLAKRMVNEKLLRGIHFSLHGLKETHEEITRVNKSFDRTLKGIEWVLGERARTSKAWPQVTIACTISGTNMKEAEGLIQLAGRLRVDRISFGHASFMPSTIRNTHQQIMKTLGLAPDPDYDDLVQGPPQISVNREDLEIYIRTLLQVRCSPEGAIVKTSPEDYREDDMRKHFLDLGWKFKTSCTYPWRNLRIGPDGTVTPCVGYRIGNIREQDVRQLWNHPRFRNFRSALYRQKLFPGCIRCCKLK